MNDKINGIEAKQPNIVETYQLGNTTVHIADNAFRDNNQEQTEKIWKAFYAAAWVVWNASNKEEGES